MNTHRYYLQVDNEVVDFETCPNFENMENFLNLSLFTSCFSSEEDLIDGLKKIGLLSEFEKYESVIITKRKGNKKSGYVYEPIYEDILYKKAFRFLSVHSISEFLHNNRQNFPLVREIISYYLHLLEKLVEIFNHKIIDLKSTLHYASDRDMPKIMSQIQSKENSLRNFATEISNLSRLLIVAKKLEYLPFENIELLAEYYDFSDRFVRNETGYYVKDKKLSTNYRGLVRLANKVQDLIERYQDVNIPSPSTKYSVQRLKMLKLIRDAISFRDSLNEPQPKVSENDDMEYSDPDSFMLLESEDYEKLISEASPQTVVDGVMNNIENLQEQQRNYGKR